MKMSFAREQNRGFTLVEVLVVVAILALIVFIATGLGANTLTKNQIGIETDQMISLLRRAQARSVSGYQDDVWGVHLTSTDYTLFKSNDYATRDTSFDEVYNLPSSLSASGLTDVVFEIRTGETTDTGTITLTLSASGETSTLTINSNGRITE
ncbi:MAG: prepilin-type N-terminal cleavage/methylation domain-containing protein [bacterium]